MFEEKMIVSESGQIWAESTYFQDKKRKIDYVLVANRVQVDSDMEKLTLFVENLVRRGVEFECSPGLQRDDLMFIRLHGPDTFMRHVADVHNVLLECDTDPAKRPKKPIGRCHFLHTILTRLNPRHPIFGRAPLSISQAIPTSLTSAERSLIMHKVLKSTIFGKNVYERGFEKLLMHGVLREAYPVHDGPSKWTNTGPLCDRQLLRHYWANVFVFHKQQPLYLIHKYGGAEMAFYFAFFSYYNLMLLPAAILGMVLFIMNVIYCTSMGRNEINEVCNSNLVLCPKCLEKSHCGFRLLKKDCSYAKMTCIFDDASTIFYASFMSLWWTIFLGMWRRREKSLIYMWNLMNVEADTVTRLDYFERTKYRRVSVYTGEMEPYVPCIIQFWNYSITVICCFALILTVVLSVCLVMLYKISMEGLISTHRLTFLDRNMGVFNLSSCALISCIFMKIFQPIYTKVAIHLTERENHRTLVDFYNACTYKTYALSFVNQYFPLFYLAFIKEKIYTHPGDSQVYAQLFGIRTEVCSAPGCVVGLSLLLLFILGLKTFIAHILGYLIPFFRNKVRRHRAKITDVWLPMWEKDYYLKRNSSLYILREYLEIVIQYGIVNFFVSALPCAPALALLSNLIELRTDAYKFIERYRRVLPRRMPGIGAWNSILQMITYLGTVTNAMVIAFTTSMIERIMYQYNHNMTLKGYVNSTLSTFKTRDLPGNAELLSHVGHVDVCMYRGHRYPHDHPRKYTSSRTHWKIFAIELSFVVIFEQFIWMLTSLCSSVISDVPTSIQSMVRDEQLKANEMRFKFLKENYNQKQNNSKGVKFRLEVPKR